MMTPLVGAEAVHLHQQLVQRLFALVVPAAQACASLAAHGVDLIDEDDAGMVFWPLSNRSRTREAPTPTNISTKSEPEMEKKGTPASPATALASRVLPVPGGPTSSTPLGMRAPRVLYSLEGILQEPTISRSSSLFLVRPRPQRWSCAFVAHLLDLRLAEVHLLVAAAHGIAQAAS